MAASFPSGLLVGFVAGVAVTAAALLLRPTPSTEPTRPSPLPVVAVKGDPEPRPAPPAEPVKTSAPAPAPKAEPPAVAPSPEVRDLFGKLVALGLGGFRDPKFAETLQAVKSAGKPAVEYLMNAVRTSPSATERFLAAALLEAAGDASAVPALADALHGDKDLLVRRMASHGLAVLASPEGEAPLRAAATGDADWGVRVNSAYGLAKLGKDDGLRLLQESYESPTTPAEYRLAILGGLADVAAPSTAPLFRRILSDTQDSSYLLMSIGAVEKMKDTGALPALQALLASTQPDLVKQRAAQAIEAIGK